MGRISEPERGRADGYTLIELIFTVAIIAVVGSLSLQGLENYRIQAEKITRVHNLRTIEEIRDIYAVLYPDRAQPALEDIEGEGLLGDDGFWPSGGVNLQLSSPDDQAACSRHR